MLLPCATDVLAWGGTSQNDTGLWPVLAGAWELLLLDAIVLHTRTQDGG